MLTILKLLLSLANSAASYVERKQLMDAGEARYIRGQINEAQERVAIANKARDDSNRDFDNRGGVPNNDDPNLRD